MPDLSVVFTQIERSDLADLKAILCDGFSEIINSTDFCNYDLTKWYDSVFEKGDVWYGIRVSKGGESGRNFLVGVCGLVDIDAVARSARLVFIMVDKSGKMATLQNHPPSRKAFRIALDKAFLELNLNKVWIQFLDGDEIKPILSEHRFSADGIRREAAFKRGIMVNQYIFSLLLEEYTG